MPWVSLDKCFAKPPFLWEQALAFAHFDTEGHELTILRGMQRVVARNRPLFSVEAYPLSSKRAYSQLRRFIHGMNYTMHEVLTPEPYNPNPNANLT